MSQTVIQVEGLGKRYRIGELESNGLLRDALSRVLRSPLSALRRKPQETFWALKDVSFEVREGEVLGLIGRNGAGKTTLLKILSRITRPTTGWAELRGRVRSLLEVGTGFHGELSGRENIYFCGSILGMRKREIERKFDEIVAFTEVEKFIDTPVKHYSSGMYVRLAFGVAAHLEPDILLVDEVLAVGDAAFQKKCLGKMNDVATQGRTVLFVSHQVAAVQNLCSRTLWLDQGLVRMDGPTGQILDRYIDEVLSPETDVPLAERRDRDGNRQVRFMDLYWKDSCGEIVSVLRSGKEYRAVLSYECPDGVEKRRVLVSLGIKDHSGTFVLLHQTDFNNGDFELIPAKGRFVCRISELPLTAGEYSVSIFVGTQRDVFDCIEYAGRVTVEYGDFFGTGHVGRPEMCKFLTKCDWELEAADGDRDG